MQKAEKNDATVLVRLPNDLKAMLMREASVNGRRITAEINMRLKASLETTGITPASVPGVLPRSYTALQAEQKGSSNAPKLSEDDQALLAAFRRMAPEKKLALLALLK